MLSWITQAGIKIVRRNNNLRYADDATLMTESKEELKSFWMKVKEESEQAGLKQEMATHSSILAWRIPWTEEPDRLRFMGSQELDTT